MRHQGRNINKISYPKVISICCLFVALINITIESESILPISDH